MGLDMFVFKTKEEPDCDVDFVVNGSEEVYYWRKHPNLHGWMSLLYKQKGGVDERWEFYGPVRLRLEDLDDLEADIINKSLPHTEGFFFGRSICDEKEMNQDLEFVKMARDEIEAGWIVYYTSSW